MTTLDQDDINLIVQAIQTAMSPAGELYVGQGLGANYYEDWLTGVNDAPIANAIIRVFPYVNGIANFDSCSARTITESDGRFVLFLDSGFYVLRVEKAGVVLMTEIITVTDNRRASATIAVTVTDSASVTTS